MVLAASVVWTVEKTQSGISADMMANPIGTEPTLAAYFRFDDGTISNRGHTGTLQGSAVLVTP